MTTNREVPDSPTELLPGRIDLGPSYKEPSPALCNGNAQNPHHSKHQPTTISAMVSTDCRAYVPTLIVRGQMWENRWWGFDRIGDPAESAQNNAIIVRAVPSAPCRTNVMRVTGRHESVEGGRVYSLDTENVQAVSC